MREKVAIKQVSINVYNPADPRKKFLSSQAIAEALKWNYLEGNGAPLARTVAKSDFGEGKKYLGQVEVIGCNGEVWEFAVTGAQDAELQALDNVVNVDPPPGTPDDPPAV